MPSDIIYTISVSDLSEYKTPPSTSRLSVSNNSISITISYIEKPPTGVYCVDTSGNTYTYDNWPDSADPLGVAVITDSVSLLMAGEMFVGANATNFRKAYDSFQGTTLKYGRNGTLINTNTCFTTTDSSIVVTDMNGKNNTNAIINSAYGTLTKVPAAGFCYEYSKGYKGAGEWWLPSVGEWNIFLDNGQQVHDCLWKMGFDSLINVDITLEYFIMSTQYDKDKCWAYSGDYDKYIGISKDAGNTHAYFTRPITTL